VIGVPRPKSVSVVDGSKEEQAEEGGLVIKRAENEKFNWIKEWEPAVNVMWGDKFRAKRGLEIDEPPQTKSVLSGIQGNGWAGRQKLKQVFVVQKCALKNAGPLLDELRCFSLLGQGPLEKCG